jgi:cyclophilin family peptidyl-prolyl cis-trans isomerase
MKLPLLTAVLLSLSLAAARADDVALLQIHIKGTGETIPVAFSFYEGDAQNTVANFKKLAKKGFYDGCLFHRAFPHTLVQAGDPYSKHSDRSRVGTGGPGYTLLPEIRHRHGVGDVSMARLPDKINPTRVSNGSQFFVCLAPLPEYDGKYTVFAHVLYGLDTLERISEMPVDSNDFPTERVSIQSVKILPHEQLPPPPVPGAKKAKRPWWKLWGSSTPAQPAAETAPPAEQPRHGGRRGGHGSSTQPQ